MARAIDADVAIDRYYAEWELQDICSGDEDRDWLMKCINEAPTIEPKQEWISVKDRLPELNKRVFAHVVDMAKGKRLFLVGGYDGKFWFVQTAVTTLIFDTMYKVTHWMPLPEPPKEGE